jgi:hypothetical protein
LWQKVRGLTFRNKMDLVWGSTFHEGN